MTLGDKIRSMSDEELAEFMTKGGYKFCIACPYTMNLSECTACDCKDGVLKGLKQKWEVDK